MKINVPSGNPDESPSAIKKISLVASQHLLRHYRVSASQKVKNHRNLEQVCFRWSSKHFWQKKSADLRPRQGNLLQRTKFIRLSKTSPYSTKYVNWRPAGKKLHFFQYASSSSTKISM
jgi:hypothetical protein